MNGEDIASLELQIEGSQSRSNMNGEDVASLELQIEGSQGIILNNVKIYLFIFIFIQFYVLVLFFNNL